jgi:4-amino-4-deoxy-L-arabinose transferase-like glycosyltransferase
MRCSALTDRSDPASGTDIQLHKIILNIIICPLVGTDKRMTLKGLINSQYVWLFLIMLLVFALRLPIADVSVIDWDESVYFTIAQDITNGGVPYKTAWDTKGPLLFFVFVPVILLFDESIGALRIFTTFYLLLSMFFLYAMARRFFHGFTSLVPPLIYGLCFTTPGLGGFASNGELFMMLPVILALLCFLDYEIKGSMPLLFLSGLFTGAAFFTKGTAVFSAFVVPLFIIYRNINHRNFDIISFFKETACYSLGVLSVVLILTAYFSVHGAVYDFYYTYFVINGRYVGAVSLRDAAYNLYHFIYGIVVWSRDFGTLLAAASSLVILIQLIRRKFSDEEKRTLLFIVALTVLSLVGVLWGRRMFPHYYLQMSLSFSLLVALGVSKLGLDRKYVQAVILALAAAFLIYYPVTRSVQYAKNEDKVWFEADTSYAVADYIRNNTSEDETVLVIGGQPIIQFLSDRKPPIKDFWWPNHHEVLFEILNLKEAVPPALNANKPVYFVFYEGKHEGQITRIDYIDKFINDNYYLEKEIGGYKLYRVRE